VPPEACGCTSAPTPPIWKAAGDCDKIDRPPQFAPDTVGWGIKEADILASGDEVKADGTQDIRTPRRWSEIWLRERDPSLVVGVAWTAKDMNGIIDVKLGPSGQPIFGAGGHAMVLVGFEDTGEQKYFIVKNSWGTENRARGYLRLSYDYIRTYARYGYVTPYSSFGKDWGLNS
jgi:hypothetical protein